MHYLHFSFGKHVLSQVFSVKDFSVFSAENVETTSCTFLSKFSCEIYLSRIINYWSSIFTLYWTWGAFSLVCVLSVFLFFLSSFFSCRIFLDRRGNYPLSNIYVVHRDSYHLFLLDVFVITRLIADRLVFLRDLHLICIFIDAI